MFKHTVILGALFGLVGFASPALADGSSWASCESAIKSCNEKDGEFKRLTKAVTSACQDLKKCTFKKREWKAEKTWLKNAKKTCNKKCKADHKGKAKRDCQKVCKSSYKKAWSQLLSDERANLSKKYCRQKYKSSACKGARAELGGYIGKRGLTCAASLYFACNAKK